MPSASPNRSHPPSPLSFPALNPAPASRLSLDLGFEFTSFFLVGSRSETPGQTPSSLYYQRPPGLPQPPASLTSESPVWKPDGCPLSAPHPQPCPSTPHPGSLRLGPARLLGPLSPDCSPRARGLTGKDPTPFTSLGPSSLQRAAPSEAAAECLPPRTAPRPRPGAGREGRLLGWHSAGAPGAGP